jgi:hypothetical protein
MSGLRPDIVAHSPSTKKLFLVELTISWESRIEEQHNFKTAKYGDLATELRRKGFIVDSGSGCQGFGGLVDFQPSQEVWIERGRQIESTKRYS